MKTRVVRIDPKNPREDVILKAANIICSGGLVGFPTETVYGLGANAFDATAIRKIFTAKGRPSDNPLIVHISNIDDVERVAAKFPYAARSLSSLWPGPITMIMKKRKEIPLQVTAGLDTVAVRLPSHPIAKALIEKAGVPIAAPSANRSGRPSPTKAEHVIRDLSGRIDMILDGGATSVGVESTVIDTTVEPPVLLRPGGVTLEQLEALLGEVAVHPAVLDRVDTTLARSPGMKYTHYAPESELILVEGELEHVEAKIRSLSSQLRSEGKRVGVLATNISEVDADVFISLGSDPVVAARNLFDSFRHFDEIDVDVILAEDVDRLGMGLAVSNRLRRASSSTIHA